MNCGHVERLVEGFVDGRLPSRLAERIQSHLAGCDRCRSRVEEARSIARVLGSRERAAAPQGFSRSVMMRIYREQAASGRREMQVRRSFRRLGYSFVATAAILSASLFIPRLAYPALIGSQALAAQLTTGRPEIVARVISDAGVGFRDAISTGSPAAPAP